MPYSGAAYLESLGLPLSPLGRRVADLVAQVTQGIYHITQTALRTDWSREDVIEIHTNHGHLAQLASYDPACLTFLLVDCHDAKVQLEIRPTMILWQPNSFHDEELAADLAELGLDAARRLGEPGFCLRFRPREDHPTLEVQAAGVRQLTAGLERRAG